LSITIPFSLAPPIQPPFWRNSSSFNDRSAIALSHSWRESTEIVFPVQPTRNDPENREQHSLPNSLKGGLEQLSGFDLSDARVLDYLDGEIDCDDLDEDEQDGVDSMSQG
jgi:hypothetical protein